LIFLSITGYSKSQTKCNIKQHYGEFITVQKMKLKNEEFLVKKFIEISGKENFVNVINSNINYLNYLLTNFSALHNSEVLLKIADSLTLQKEYIKLLISDTVFNGVMTELIAKTVEKSMTKDTILMDKMLDIAVKYFSINRINENGDFVGKVCAGLNDIEKTEKVRRAQLEAFCFSSILKNYKSTEFSMYDEFVSSVKELYKVNLGVSKDERLLRAQGAMYILMRKNENLKKMLIYEYEKNKENYPFILIKD